MFKSKYRVRKIIYVTARGDQIPYFYPEYTNIGLFWSKFQSPSGPKIKFTTKNAAQEFIKDRISIFNLKTGEFEEESHGIS